MGDWQNLDFWYELREKTSIHPGIGNGKCEKWADEALALLKDRKDLNFRKVLDRRNIPLLSTGVCEHTWIETEVEGNLFVADGTAGQLDPLIDRKGFYGFVHEAPLILREIYKTPHDSLLYEMIRDYKGDWNDQGFTRESEPDYEKRKKNIAKRRGEYLLNLMSMNPCGL